MTRFVIRINTRSRTRGVAKTRFRVPTLGGKHYFFLLLMQHGASNSHFFDPSKLKRLILPPANFPAGGSPPGWSRVARVAFGGMAGVRANDCCSRIGTSSRNPRPWAVDGRVRPERFVYLTSWDLGREGSLRAAALRA